MFIRHLTAIPVALFSSALFAVETERAAAGLERTPITTGTLVETIGGLAVVILLIVVLGWGFKKFAGMPLMGKGAISILGGVSLGPREKAVLLQVGETQLLVGVAPGRVQTLHVLTEPVSLDTKQALDSGFNKKLKQVMTQGDEEK